jgi:hypothetical protein
MNDEVLIARAGNSWRVVGGGNPATLRLDQRIPA